MRESILHGKNWITPALLALSLVLRLAAPTRAADLSGTYTWAPVKVGAGGFVTGFCSNPANPNVRFCRTDIGNAYRWDNANNVWMPMIVRNSDGTGMPASAAPAPAGSGCEEIATDPGNANVVYMSAPFYYSGDTGLASNNGAVWKSTDGGKNFTATSMVAAEAPNNSWRTVSERIKVDPNNGNKVYYGSLGNGLWVTTNGGTTWTQVSAGGAPGITTNVFNIAYYKGGGTMVVGGVTVSKVIYLDEAPNGRSAPNGGDVYRSTDGGQTWTNISSGAPVSGNAAKITVDQNGNVWVGSLTGANYFKYSGGAWTTITAGMNGAVAGLAVDPANANRVFLMGGGGDMARSLDGGATWTLVQTAYSFANTLGWLPQNPTLTTYYWRSNAGLYFDANGVLWSPEGNEGMLTFTPSADNHESTTNPPLWSIVSQGIEEFVTHDVIIPAGQGDTAFINVEDATAIKVTNPATFTAKQCTLQGTQLISLGVGEAWCPNAPSYVVETTIGNSNYTGYSSDLGVTWNIFAAAPASSWPGSIAVSRRGAWGLGSDHIVVLPDNNGLPVYSKNGGASWATCSTFPSANGGFWAFFIYPRQLRADPFTADKYYIYDGTHLAVTTDGGVNWSSISSGTLPTQTSNGDLETNYLVQNDLWFADGFQGGIGHGVWHSTNGGTTWTQIPFFTHAITMTLGKGDGGTGHPASAVYVYGCASDNIYGVYRSVDGGANWDRISYYPAGIFDQATSMASSWDTYGLVYMTFTGNTAVYGKITGGSPPPAPTGLNATAGNAQVTLTWNASTGATAYDVKRSTVSGSGYVTVSSPTVTNYTNTGLTNGTTYYFVVDAKNASGTSGNSAQASATPAVVPQAQIIAGTATIDGTVEAAWNAATAYTLTKTTGTITNGADCSATWKGMWDATNLYILASVTDDVKVNDSTSPWDDDSIEIYLDADHNGGTTYDANDRQIDCGWGDATPVEGAGRSITGAAFAKADPTGTTYVIEAKVPWAIEAFTPAANAIIGIDIHVNDDDDGGARDGKLEWNDGTDFAWNNPSLFGTGKLLAGGSPPPAPTGLTATPGNAQVALSWTASSGATAYDVKRSTVSGSGYVTVSSPTVTTYTNTGLTNGTTYYFVVDAKNANGASGNSAQASATPTASLTPVIQINSGGAAASPYIADTDFSGGGTFTTGATIDTSAVTNPAPVAVYQAERDGVFTYTIPSLTVGALYTVRLHFAETNFNGAGLRKFNVAINSTTVLTNFDIWATAGAENKANIQTFTTNANASGQIVIAFTNGTANNPKVSGIEILH